MKKIDFNTQEWEDVRTIMNYYTFPGNARKKNGAIMPTDYMICIDDGPESAMLCALNCYEHRKRYGYLPKCLPVGGIGLLSQHSLSNPTPDGQKFTHEAAKLNSVLKQFGLGVPETEELGLGTDTAKNLKAISAKIGNKRAIFCVTPRLSYRLYSTQQFQFPDMNVLYDVLPQTVEETCRLYNGKGLVNGEVFKHEVVSIPNRCLRYAGKFQLKSDKDIPQEVLAAYKRLLKKYYLKTPIQFWEFGKIFHGVKKHNQLDKELKYKAVEIHEDLCEEIAKFKEKILTNCLATRAEMGLF